MQVAASLPKSSNFKLVDVWLVFCIFSTFIIIVFHVIIDLLQFAEAQAAVRAPAALISAFGRTTGKETFFSHAKKEMEHSQTDQRFKGFPGSNVQRAWESKEMKSGKALLTVKTNRRSRIRLTMRGMERFGRIFVASVFLVFNVIYWLTAYTTS